MTAKLQVLVCSKKRMQTEIKESHIQGVHFIENFFLKVGLKNVYFSELSGS